MRPIRKTVSSQAASEPIPVDHYVSPFSVGVDVKLSGGATLTYSVQHTFDDIHAAGFNPATARWEDNTGLTGQSASADGNYAFPVTAIRLNVSAYTTGNATITVVQAGRGNC